MSTFTNGFVPLPSTLGPGAPSALAYYVQVVWPDGSTGDANSLAYQSYTFYDGRSQIADNLAFLLRAASEDGPPCFLGGGYAWTNTYPTNYAVAGLWGSDLSTDFGDGSPFTDNYLYENFVFSATAMASGTFWNS